MRKSQNAFTIVELLIVIVVIAILAAISIVAYNGIQTRSRNAQQLTAAKGYLTAFAAYVAANGVYPSTGGPTRICLNLDQASCMNNTSWNRNATLESNLKTITNPLPNASPSLSINSSSPKMGYVPVSDVTLDGTYTPFLIYTLEPPGTCTSGTPASGTWPNMSSAAPTQGYTFTDGSVRVCMIPMPRT